MQVGPSLLVLGDDARRYGLKLSLFERLHAMYVEKGECTQTHSITLLTNYRCHHTILSLPSYLFYESALLTKAKASTHSSLNGLHFICSSLDAFVKEVKSNVNMLEVTLLMQEALAFVESSTQHVKVCIMVATNDKVWC